ncbi:FkbM family methyltransferase [Dyella soli]|nr:FkbM family methyltransferase [Dyella soli]
MDAISDIKRQWDSRVPHETDFYFFRNLTIQNPVVVDVGANAGQSVVSFMCTCNPGRVVSFEPNPRYAAALEHLKTHLMTEGLFEYHLMGCGSSSGRLDLVIPYVDGEPYFQEASLSVSHFEISWVKERLQSYGRELSFQTLQIAIAPMDTFNLRPSVCKIDAEGWELDVLQGMADTIQASPPIFLIENNDYTRVTAFLTERGYTAYEYRAASNSLVPLSQATTNTFYLRPQHFAWLSTSLGRN